MRLAVLKERRTGENRVAATPDTVKKLIALGLTVAVEAGAGLSAAITDADFSAAGAEIAPDAAIALTGAGILFAVQAPEPEVQALVGRGTLLVCTMNTYSNPTLLDALAAAGIDGVAMEMVPRITRAQSMDVLSSQANLAG
jgi:NAD(P) transhydrogenase subunit alpha